MVLSLSILLSVDSPVGSLRRGGAVSASHLRNRRERIFLVDRRERIFLVDRLGVFLLAESLGS